MKNLKCAIILLAAVTMLSAGSITVMAADYQTPADVVAGLTGRTVEDVIQERFDTGKTYGTIAEEAGKLDDFKSESLNLKEDILNENVADGLLSQEEADDILDAIKARQAICDGTGYGDGLGCGYGRGAGFGRGQGFCGGRGAGRGFRDGSCWYYNNS